MSLGVNVCMFSGRPDPWWELSESESDKIMQELQRERPKAEKLSARNFLGYRGVEVFDRQDPCRFDRAVVYDGVIEYCKGDETSLFIDEGSSLEEYLLNSAPSPAEFSEELKHMALQDVQKNVHKRNNE
uniref:Uncharacterized protein n=1 Tax=Vannella robusta TaxID=1487602 RepID=A0A7S4I245_9EUKA|mmetsp:Transcript_19284/g.24375  ORF Transcript_19284/g.24375 Transcript_19284/m.24375 type:complete len:129 (+) Transcript_19284:2-388(+)